MTAQNLLVELFVEELPPKALKKLGDAFATVLADQLRAQGLAPADAVVTVMLSATCLRGTGLRSAVTTTASY
ncbi:hypothetical protein [Hydrogenophaga sp.]|uniref:hypothetical protein n=1 Tax=Hydrogenophaga sp. TaxID=1904254 RepID=UPI003D0E6970